MKGLAYCLWAPFGLLAVLGNIFALPSLVWGAHYSLKAATVQAFTNYVMHTEQQHAQTLREGPFLWVDGLPPQERDDAISKLRSGEVPMRRLSVAKDGGNIDVPGGMIHDWQGIVFIPGAHLDDVLKFLQDYNHHASYYAPDVSKSQIEERQGEQFRVFMQLRRQKIVTVVLNTEHLVNYYRDSPVCAHSRSSAMRIAQVDNPGSANEKEKPVGADDGYLWRMETWWRMEERDGGVYVQSEAVTLTRDIPVGLGWLVEPFITKIPEETLQFTLRATRKAVLANTGQSPVSGDQE